MNGLKMTYWTLLQNYKIVIPKIQRDYAQGRDNDQAKDVRQSLIPAVFAAVGGSDLELDFIYGRTLGDQFIPIDGQQRLTTLHLIHVYLALRTGNSEDFSVLSRFQYETRDSSSEFCAKITELENWNGCEYKHGELGRWVSDQSWFQPEWLCDPTVKGMVRTLEDINSYAHGMHMDCPKVLRSLKSGEHVHFQFMPMDEYGLSDDLYIKMNARGLPLTVSQRFKSSLEKYYYRIRKGLRKEAGGNLVAQLDDDLVRTKPGLNGIVEWGHPLPPVEKRFAQLFDNEWADYFWSSRKVFDKRAVVESEAAEFAFMSRLMAMVYIEMHPNAQELQKDEALGTLVSISGIEKFISFPMVFEPILNKDPNRVLRFVADAMTNIVANSNMVDCWLSPSWVKSPRESLAQMFTFDGESHAPTFAVLATVYSIVKYFELGVPVGSESFRQWMRISHNVIHNAEVEDKESFISFIKLWNEICSEIAGCSGANNFSLIGYFSTISCEGRFGAAALKQESLKAWLICASSQDASSESEAYQFVEEIESRPFYSGNVVFQIYDAADPDARTITLAEVKDRDKWIRGYVTKPDDTDVVPASLYPRFMKGLIAELGNWEELHQLFGTGKGNAKNLQATRAHYHQWIRLGEGLQLTGIKALLRFYKKERGVDVCNATMSADATYNRARTLLTDKSVLDDIAAERGFRKNAGIQSTYGHWCIHRPYDSDPKSYYLLDSPLYEVLNALENDGVVKVCDSNIVAGRICGWPVKFCDKNGVEYKASPEEVYRCEEADKKYKGVPWTKHIGACFDDNMKNSFMSAMRQSSDNCITKQ